MTNEPLEIKIYKYGRYDVAANIKLKARNMIRVKGHELANSIDYFFTEFAR